MQSKRRAITAGQLYVILDREFRMRQSPRCGNCYILLPYRVDEPDGDRANWEVGVPPECPYECAGIVDQLVEKYSEPYDLSPDAGD
jgi:hypothetical protein